MPSNESALNTFIVDHLNSIHWPIYRATTGKFRTLDGLRVITVNQAGYPDFTVGYKLKTDGLYLLAFIESKDLAKISDEQVLFLRNIHKLGIPWLICHTPEHLYKWVEDRNYHGEFKDVNHVLDESRKFIPTQIRRKKQKLTTSTLNEYNRWADRNGK